MKQLVIRKDVPYIKTTHQDVFVGLEPLLNNNKLMIENCIVTEVNE